MKNPKGLIPVVVVLVIFVVSALVVGAAWWYNNEKETTTETKSNNTTVSQTITSFDECVTAGNPIMESYPRQCKANGQTFVEDISDDLIESKTQGSITYKPSADLTLAEKNCIEQGGTFNECGRACEEGVPCIAVCVPFCTLSQDTQNAPLGGDADEHGCIGSAGYTWCEDKQKCLRTWEEECATSTNESNAEDKGIPSDWLTYSSDELGVSFMYPSGWDYSEQDVTYGDTTGKNVQFTTPVEDSCATCPDYMPRFAVTMFDYHQGDTVGEAYMYADMFDDYILTWETKDVVVGNVTEQQYIGLPGYSSYDETPVIRNGYFYTLTRGNDSNQERYEQILSTIEFFTPGE